LRVFPRPVTPALIICACLVSGAPVSAEVDAALAAPSTEESRTALTAEAVKNRADDVAAASGLDEATQALLAELYRQSIGSLEAVKTYREAAQRFETAIQASKEDTARLRAELEQKHEAVDARVPETGELSLAGAELQLQEAKAELATLDAQLAEIRSRVQKEKERPAAVRRLTSDAKNRIIELESGPAKLVGNEPQDVLQARAWVKETRLEQLRAEILMLGQELASHPMRIEALRAQRDLAQFNLAAVQAQVAALEAVVNETRLQDTERAKVEARAAEIVTAGKHPLLVELAARNRQLSEEVDALAGAIEKLEREEKQATEEATRIEQNFSAARQKIEVAGVSQILGRLLLEQRRSLPDVDRFKKRAKARERKVAETTLSKFLLEEERRDLLDPEAYIAKRTSDMPAEDLGFIGGELHELAVNRLELVDKALAIQRAYLQAMAELDFAQLRQADAIERFDAFLDKRLLWVRSTQVVGLDTARRIPGQFAALLEPDKWRQVLDSLLVEAASPDVAIVILLVAGLLFARRPLLRMLKQSGSYVGNLLRDSLGSTLRALLIVVLLALPWPLLLFAISRMLLGSDDAAAFTRTVGQVLAVLAPLLFELKALSFLVAPGSVAGVHFGWRERGLELLQRDLRWFTPLLVGTSFFTVLEIYSSDQAWGSGLGRAAFLANMGLFSIFFFRFTKPSGGTLSVLFADNQQSRVFRWRHLWFLSLVFLPLAAAGAALAGYMYTALTVIGHIINTLWFTLLIVILHQFIFRWLVLNQRKMRLQAARERRRVEQEARAAEEDSEGADGVLSRDIEEPEIDLKALDAASRSLTNNAFLTIGVIGVWFIWRDMLPALKVLDDITLWSYSKPGVENVIPITPLSLGLALLILAVMLAATRQLPAFLEITLLQRLKISQGSRYTVVTLTKYTVVAVGVSWIFSTLGGSWSEIQWILAALGVGIGFGLQEIVANFISGLIILFERPIRVGDVVTVGNTDGIVTRIRIRATTIRNWDRQELLVPNKNFITQEVINWSLSDQTTRILINLGIAYGSNVDRAMLILEEVATEHPRIMEDPAPFVVFEEFGDNALLLSLRCYIDDIDFRLRTITELNQSIYRNMNDAGIEIAFPQQDVHLDTRRPLDIRIQNESAGRET
jgi:potassium efflux system protein